jgi:hypothetical protein
MGTTMDKVFIQIDNDVVELTGQALADFLAQRAKDQAELDKAQAKIDEAKTAKDSATAKLAALGLTEAEIFAITGQTKAEQSTQIVTADE